MMSESHLLRIASGRPGKRRSGGKATEGIGKTMPNNIPTPTYYKQSEILDVELLDAFAQIEALLRGGREVQREALRVRGLPNPVSPAERLAAARSIQQHLTDMIDQCRSLGDVLRELQGTANELESSLEAEGAQSHT
jgi:hypothetical protein